MDLNLDGLGMTDMIRLQDRLSEALRRRFGKQLGLCFTDIVGSMAHFAAFGEEAGRSLQQRHADLLDHVVHQHAGRIVDLAGDGGFSCFARVEDAAQAMIELQSLISGQNSSRSRNEQLTVRCGLHWGDVLTDGVLVKGNDVNLCSRIAGSSQRGEIRLTREAFVELSNDVRMHCRPLLSVDLKGIPHTVEVMVLEWRDRSLFPSSVRIEETGELIVLPDQDAISFGRMGEGSGGEPNDVVLVHPDPALARQISRWHFELRRYPDGFVLRSISQGLTEVDGRSVPKGTEVRIRVGSVVRLSRILSVTFLEAPPRIELTDSETLFGSTGTLPGRVATGVEQSPESA